MEDRVFEIREYLDGRSELVDLEAELGELSALAKRRQDEAEAQKNGEKSEAVRKVLDDLNKKMQDMPTPTAGGDNADLSLVCATWANPRRSRRHKAAGLSPCCGTFWLERPG
jgi:hypothetical protein